MKTLVFLTICLAASAEPAALAKRREVYLRELQKLEAAYNKKVKILTWRYIHGLNKAKVAYTKAGKLEEALAVRDEIDELKGALTRGEAPKKPEPSPGTGGRRVNKVVLFQTTNGRFGDVGTKRGTVIIYRGDKEVFRKRFSMAWRPGKTTSAEIKLIRPVAGVTRVLVECHKNRSKDLNAVGLAEIEVYVGEKNIARQAKITASNVFNSNHKVENLIDGITDSSLGDGGNWATRTPDGWVSLTWSK